MSTKVEIKEITKKARAATTKLVGMSSAEKDQVLLAMALELESRKAQIQEANKLDLEAFGGASAMADRLDLNDKRFSGMVQGVREIAELEDPVGAVLNRIERPNGLVIEKVRVPIGVIGIIYESRPNVTADAAALCFKSANAVILRGGKEAIHTNKAISEALNSGGKKAGLPEGAIQLIQTTDREAVGELCRAEEDVDVIIPRGGEGLIRAVVEQARVPVLKHYKGVCHIYVDESAELNQALAIIQNAKTQRPGVCNAVESLLVHEKVAAELLPKLAQTMPEVELRGCAETLKILPGATPATEADWSEEYLELILSVKVVSDVEEAITHINTYGSRHTDAILTASDTAAQKFQLEVDTASCMVNASTRFSDGSVFGMGAEIGISTDKLHARGPMGLEELCTYKFLVKGDGQVRE